VLTLGWYRAVSQCTLGGSWGYRAGMVNVNVYLTPDQYPLSGVTSQTKFVRSEALGKLMELQHGQYC